MGIKTTSCSLYYLCMIFSSRSNLDTERRKAQHNKTETTHFQQTEQSPEPEPERPRGLVLSDRDSGVTVTNAGLSRGRQSSNEQREKFHRQGNW